LAAAKPTLGEKLDDDCVGEKPVFELNGWRDAGLKPVDPGFASKFEFG